MKQDGKTIGIGDRRLYVDLELGHETVDLRLRERGGERLIGCSTLLALEVWDRRMPRVDTVAAYRVLETESVVDGVHLTLYAPAYDIYCGVWLLVRDGELRNG